jgi:hypothetical protein
MKKGTMILLSVLATVFFFAEKSFGQECVSPAFEYYMGVPMGSTCTEISLGTNFINPFDELTWHVNTTDSAGNIIESIMPGTPFYLKIVGSGYWGIGYMPHLYAPGNYYTIPMTWEQSWLGSPEYTGSASGDIFDLDDIINRNPVTVYEPNLVIKTPVFASATGNNTLIVAQEQVFLGWWGGPWTEPDYEIITWLFGPFEVNSSASFMVRILMSPIYNEEIYVADNNFTVPTACNNNDSDGYFQEAAGCAAPYDCDDLDPGINPGIEETPGNSIDEDCDGIAVCDRNILKNHGQYMNCLTRHRNNH